MDWSEGFGSPVVWAPPSENGGIVRREEGGGEVPDCGEFFLLISGGRDWAFFVLWMEGVMVMVVGVVTRLVSGESIVFGRFGVVV